MPRTFQSKGFVLKTVSRPALDLALSFVRGVAGSRWAYALHEPAPPKVPHWHLVALFVDRVFWQSCSRQVHALDTCASDDTCRKPRRAVRYLLHLDSPEKHPVPRDSLVTGGDWGPDELEDWLDSSSAATSIVDTCLSLWRDGLEPLEAFSRLVQFGYEPFQISSALQAFTRLHDFWLKHAPQITQRGTGALRRPRQCIHGAPLSHGKETTFPPQSKKSEVQDLLSAKNDLHSDAPERRGNCVVDRRHPVFEGLGVATSNFNGVQSLGNSFRADDRAVTDDFEAYGQTLGYLPAFFFSPSHCFCDCGEIQKQTKQKEKQR